MDRRTFLKLAGVLMVCGLRVKETRASSVPAGDSGFGIPLEVPVRVGADPARRGWWLPVVKRISESANQR